MKINTKTTNSLLIPVVLFATLLLSSCQDDAEKSPAIDDSAKKEQVSKVLAFREELNFVNRFVNDNVTDIANEGGRQSSASSSIERLKTIAPCVDIVEEELEDGSKKISLNFGDGCQTEEGIEVAGKVEMLFWFDESTFEFSLEFIDYKEINGGEHQDEVVNGTVSGSFVFDLQNSKFTQDMEQDLTITYPNNLEAIYRVAQRAEMTETGLRIVSLTTSGNFADGGEFLMTLSKALVYDFSCDGDFPIEGEESLTFQGNHMKVFYGNGTCDREYTVK